MGNNQGDIKALKKEIETKRQKLEELKEIAELKDTRSKLNQDIDYNTHLESNRRKEKGITAIKNMGKMVGLGFRTVGRGVNAVAKAADHLPSMEIGDSENSKEKNTKKKNEKEGKEKQSGQDSVGW